MLVIGIALGVIAAALIVLIVLMIRKSRGPAPTVSPAPAPVPQTPPSERTMFAGEYMIQLSDVRHPGQKWKKLVIGEITIGRDPGCALVLTDSGVSRHHCKITADEAGLLLSNLSDTNQTEHNGRWVSGDVLLKAGDVLKLGRDELRVDFIKSQSSSYLYKQAPPDEAPAGDETPFDKTTRFF